MTDAAQREQEGLNRLQEEYHEALDKRGRFMEQARVLHKAIDAANEEVLAAATKLEAATWAVQTRQQRRKKGGKT